MSVIKNFYHKLQRKFEKPKRYYNIDGFDMDLGEGHMLSLIQKYNPMYDRFVPYLAKLVQGNSKWIVDIGANVGDTTAAMIKHTNANILCVEPTEKFYNLLIKNISNFGELYNKRIMLANAFIAADSAQYTSVTIGGTAVMCESNESNIPAYTLPNLLKRENIDINNVALIKTDTDGFDSDCMMSMGEYLKDISPFLYWENQIDNDMQYKKFLNMADYLHKYEYNNFFVFDNYGNYLCKTDYIGLKEMCSYINRIRKAKSTYTFRYMDVLACKDNKVIVCKNAIDEYLNVYGE
jgi:FkbM family methyltransferase